MSYDLIFAYVYVSVARPSPPRPGTSITQFGVGINVIANTTFKQTVTSEH